MKDLKKKGGFRRQMRRGQEEEGNSTLRSAFHPNSCYHVIIEISLHESRYFHGSFLDFYFCEAPLFTSNAQNIRKRYESSVDVHGKIWCEHAMCAKITFQVIYWKDFTAK